MNDFLEGKCLNTNGKHIAQIYLMSDEMWETEHDFIQWIFPTKTRSRFNPNAPVVDKIDLGQHGDYRYINMCTQKFVELFMFYTSVDSSYNHWWLRLSRFLEFRSLLIRYSGIYYCDDIVLTLYRNVLRHPQYKKFKEYRLELRKINKRSS